jgi:DNA helicase-2/ATP-dependent DNA helicase PcrA
VLVDEYQDVNPGQIKLIEHFVSDGVKLWVVGDDDQTLYAFRASDVRYVLQVTTAHPKAVTHGLERSYRACARSVRAA